MTFLSRDFHRSSKVFLLYQSMYPSVSRHLRKLLMEDVMTSAMSSLLENLTQCAPWWLQSESWVLVCAIRWWWRPGICIWDRCVQKFGSRAEVYQNIRLWIGLALPSEIKCSDSLHSFKNELILDNSLFSAWIYWEEPAYSLYTIHSFIYLHMERWHANVYLIMMYTQKDAPAHFRSAMLLKIALTHHFGYLNQQRLMNSLCPLSDN